MEIICRDSKMEIITSISKSTFITSIQTGMSLEIQPGTIVRVITEYGSPDCIIAIQGGSDFYFAHMDDVNFHEPEETIKQLSIVTGISYNTLICAVKEGRVIARRSGSTWLTTLSAIRQAGITPREK